MMSTQGKGNCCCCSCTRAGNMCGCDSICNCCHKSKDGAHSDCKTVSKEARQEKEEESSIRTISAQELKRKMEENPDLLVINVLESPYYNDCRITGSTNIPLNQLKDPAQSLEREREIVLYCAHSQCPASKNAYKILVRMGFKRSYAYEGGMKEWRERGYPHEGPCTMEYLK